MPSTYSLLTVHRIHDGQVDGGWLQDHIGTLSSAQRVADRISTANHNMPVAVVPRVGFCGPAEVFFNQRLLTQSCPTPAHS